MYVCVCVCVHSTIIRNLFEFRTLIPLAQSFSLFFLAFSLVYRHEFVSVMHSRQISFLNTHMDRVRNASVKSISCAWTRSVSTLVTSTKEYRKRERKRAKEGGGRGWDAHIRWWTIVIRIHEPFPMPVKRWKKESKWTCMVMTSKRIKTGI